MTHPGWNELALYAGGDLGLTARWRIRRHVGHCASCRTEVEGFRDAAVAVQDSASDLPVGLDWSRLSAEMTANIHLGLEAGECVSPPRVSTPRISWRAATVMASMTVVLALAWWMNPPSRPGLRSPRVEIGATSSGLELKENGGALVLLNGRAGQTERAVIVSAPGSLRARYVDADTGQITINNVYAQ